MMLPLVSDTTCKLGVTRNPDPGFLLNFVSAASAANVKALFLRARMERRLCALPVLSYQSPVRCYYTILCNSRTNQALRKPLNNKFLACKLLGLKFPGRAEIKENREENSLKKAFCLEQ